MRELCSCDVRDALAYLDKTGLYSPVLSAPTTSAGISHDAARRSDNVSENQIPGGEKEKIIALEFVESKPLEHPALLQYLTKRGIDHDIARQYLSQTDFKAPQNAWSYFTLGWALRERVFRGLTRCLRAL
jgi:hypothetical protein